MDTRTGVRSLLLVGSCLYFGAIILTQLSTGSLEATLRKSLKGDTRDLRALTFDRTRLISSNVRHQGDVMTEQTNEHSRRATSGGPRKRNTTTEGGDTHREIPVKTAPVLVDLKPPKYALLMNQPYLCHQVDDDDADALMEVGSPPVYLLIIVHSHPAHKRRRNAIRETWGEIVRKYDSRQVVIVFILGIPQDYDELKMVEKEARLYRDVVAWNFVDEYRNLTIKSIVGFYWAARFCQNAKYMMKADDDVYFNVPYLIDVLGGYPQKDLILGSLNPRSPVKRYGQWQVEYKQFPFSVFPPYCSGCAYALSGDMAARFYQVYQADQALPFIPVEDVYITGILGERLGVVCKHHDRFPTWITVPSLRFVQKFLRGSLLGLHGVDWIRMHSMWQMIHQCTNCTTDIHLTKKWLSWLMEKDPMYR